MILYALFAVLTIGIACLVRNRPAGRFAGAGCFAGQNRQQALSFTAVCILFVLLTGLASLRVEVGNDYGKYVDIFHEIYAGTDAAYVVTEPGFNFVVDAIYTLSGFENYLLVFAVFGAATAFVFLKAMYEQSVDFGGSFAMFMLLGLYFRSFTTVRYYFVLALTLYSLRYIRKREFLKFLLMVFILKSLILMHLYMGQILMKLL